MKHLRGSAGAVLLLVFAGYLQPAMAAELVITELPGWEPFGVTLGYDSQLQRYVFLTAEQLVPEDDNEDVENYLYDIESGDISWFFPPSECGPVELPDGFNTLHVSAFSNDGMRFMTRSITDVGSPGTVNDGVIVYDFETRCYTLASRDDSGNRMPLVGGEKLSGNGRYAFFSSIDRSTDPDDYRFYRHDLETGTTIEVLARHDGESLIGAHVQIDHVSHDGNKALVYSGNDGSALVQGSAADYFLVDIQRETIEALDFVMPDGSSIGAVAMAVTPTDDFSLLLVEMYFGEDESPYASTYEGVRIIERFAVYNTETKQAVPLLDFIDPPPGMLRLYGRTRRGPDDVIWGGSGRYMIMAPGPLVIPGDHFDPHDDGVVYVYDRQSHQAWISGMSNDGEILHRTMSWLPRPLLDGHATLGWMNGEDAGTESGVAIASFPTLVDISLELLKRSEERATIRVTNLLDQPVYNLGFSVISAAYVGGYYRDGSHSCGGSQVGENENRMNCVIGTMEPNGRMDFDIIVSDAGSVTVVAGSLSDPDVDLSNNSKTIDLAGVAGSSQGGGGGSQGGGSMLLEILLIMIFLMSFVGPLRRDRCVGSDLGN